MNHANIISTETIGMIVVFILMVIGFIGGVMAIQEAQGNEAEYMEVVEFVTWGNDEVAK